MVLGYHVIITTYGFWLPNDPRGSWSDFVGAWELFRFGHATRVTTRQSVAGTAHDRVKRNAAKRVLKLPTVHFDGPQALAVIQGFAACAQKLDVRVWACSILPEHVHMVVGRHINKIERIVNCMKGEATRQLLELGRHPFQKLKDEDGNVPKMWARGLWKVYLDSAADLRRAVRYVEDNPEKEGKRRQTWAFVSPLPIHDRTV